MLLNQHLSQQFCTPKIIEPLLLHHCQLLRDLEWRLRLALNLLHRNTLRMLNQRQPIRKIHLKNRQLRNNQTHTRLARQRKYAVIQNLRIALLIRVFHCDDDFSFRGVGDEIHGSAETLDFSGEGPVGEVAFGADLHGSQDGEVDAAGADHAEGFFGAEDGGAGAEGYGFLAGVDEVGVLGGGC